MTTLKMIIAVIGTLIFLGIFSATANHQGIALEVCSNEMSTQENQQINFTCLSNTSIQTNEKG